MKFVIFHITKYMGNIVFEKCWTKPEQVTDLDNLSVIDICSETKHNSFAIDKYESYDYHYE